MDSKIKNILLKIEELNRELKKEQVRISKKYGYLVKEKKVVFLEKIRSENRRFRMPAWKYAFPRSFRHLISIPFIYSMIVPAIILDIFISIYQFVAFPLYGIPKVKRKEYIVYDRRFLDYLNVIQKVHCLYCTYVNGLFSYAVEIGGRTERYWCPIKAASRPKYYHGWYKDFADYGDPKDWNCKFNDHKAFAVIEKNKNS
ncbi:MAG: hypothetical protein PHP62_05655 [Candidatus Moranbacteria bacterium]|nr:hypothetical protein [Candidatus Moranbacteria bacterium]